MPTVKAYTSDQFVLPLPAGHRFPMDKYRRLRVRVREELPDVRLVEPEAATSGQLALAHAPEYIDKVVGGRLDAAELRAIGFPWSPAMVERSRRSAGATIGACRAAIVDGIAVNLAGGTHHAQSARGAGYCVFNDAAIAARVIQSDLAATRRQTRVAIVDLDVHQGDGTAQILAGDASVFTLSLHGASNFPFRKQVSDLDIALPDGTADATYLTALDTALQEMQRRFEPQFIIYLAGADAHEDDRLGKLALTQDGMAARDRRVLDLAELLDVPIAIAMAGGYGRDIETTVAIHLQTVRAARDAWRRRQRAGGAGLRSVHG
jgi:acetoin utilization deacetylase AcuC-like enzyme